MEGTIKKAENNMNESSYLEKIVIDKKDEVDRLISPRNLFSSALRNKEFNVIAEIKRRSPSLGEIRKIEDPLSLAIKYCQGGASAISVLTDSKHFGGSIEDLRHVANGIKSSYPQVAVLRKDFIIHPIQLAESIIAGANAVLLLACLLGNHLKFFIEEAQRIGLETLTEVHDLDELNLAIAAGAPIIGINHRNLTTFEMDLNISRTLRPLIPPQFITVAESGINDLVQAEQMKKLGFDAILVGEALVRSEDPSKLISLMKGMTHES